MGRGFDQDVFGLARGGRGRLRPLIGPKASLHSVTRRSLLQRGRIFCQETPSDSIRDLTTRAAEHPAETDTPSGFRSQGVAWPSMIPTR